MRKILLSIIIAISIISCNSNSNKNDNGYTSDMRESIDNTNNNIKLLELLIKEVQSNPSIDNLHKLSGQASKCHFAYSDATLTTEQKVECLQIRTKADSIRKEALYQVEVFTKNYRTNIIQKQDYLLQTTESWPFLGVRNDVIFFNITVTGPATAKLYNTDTKETVKTYALKANQAIKDSISINNKAIYLLEIVSPKQQYADIQIDRKSSDIERLGIVEKINVKTVDAEKGDFRAVGVKGVSMKNLFEEPRKITLRGQFKAAFSGSSRALIALQVPNGASDVMYSLRIATNEKPKSEDGQFYDNMCTSYKKIKFLGLPLYENQNSSGLISTLLGENVPVREEDAYISMYVFYDASQARKFQDGTSATKLKYNIDYSTIGTQSCNGRIPSKGYNTIYLAFENERMRYNNYVWLEAISAVPNTEYYKEEYTVE